MFFYLCNNNFGNMKKQLLLCLLLVLGLSAFSQSKNGGDIVYLKDGGIVRGNIRFAEPDSTLFVDTNFGCTFVYPRNEVDHFEFMEQPPFKRHNGLKLRSSLAGGVSVAMRQRGDEEYHSYYLDDNYAGFFNNGLNMDMTIGLIYQVCDWYAVGMDLSFFFVTPSYLSSAILLDQRFVFSHKAVSPFVELKLGASPNLRGLDMLHLNYYNMYYYEESRGLENTWFTGEVAAGVAWKDMDFSICATHSPYKLHLYDGGGHLVYRLRGLSLKVAYSIPLK
jgi:hypothetical protein